ncbi:M61 family metallopeptidase [Ideonella livida]|uniref:M61 family metallopeptidase n=1 Tax=Ideonella livida TaxID=2707176 RepID=A0A7C9TLV0_9BURK|nr:M61 family metallopeptidase [Ideonella livida]NDY92744.1 M61 family metallopeptidase [Ideonella livida]
MPRTPAQPAARRAILGGGLKLAALGLTLTPLARTGAVLAQARPDATAATPAAAASPADPWPAPLRLEVEATDLTHRVLRARLQLPLARPGQRLTLHLPRYLPGTHGPWGHAAPLAGLRCQADGQLVPWQRDALDPHAFHLQPPAGAQVLQLELQHLTPLNPGEEDRVSVSRKLLGVQWEKLLLYPDGVAHHALQVQARLRLPPGWQAATALRGADGEPARPDAQGWFEFAPCSLETLVDSPVFAGPHYRRVALDAPGTARPVVLHLLADEPKSLQATEAQLQAHRALVQQADRLFTQRPWRHYDFLLAQSDAFGGMGLEHHESSENAVPPGYFDDWDKSIHERELLPHEFVHAWNGKYRRGADLVRPDYHQPGANSLLWVYEGQTEFWGHVLAARAGLSSAEQARDRLAYRLAEAQLRTGRAWRSLQDTTQTPQMGHGPTREWGEWQRGYDYYPEGLLLWLAADGLIREASAERRGLDDFARVFFGPAWTPRADGSVTPRPYRFEDLTAALAQVHRHDWTAWLRERLDATGPQAGVLLDETLARSGWRLDWSDQESRFAQAARGWGGEPRPQDLRFSLGLRVGAKGRLGRVVWDGPAFAAGLVPGMELVAVNDQAYRPERLDQALRDARDGRGPVRLLVKDEDSFRTVSFEARHGPRFPVLTRVAGVPDRLGALYAPRGA